MHIHPGIRDRVPTAAKCPHPHGLNHLTTGLWSAPLRVPFASSFVRCSSVSSFMEWSSRISVIGMHRAPRPSAPGRKPAPGPEWRKAGGLRWTNAVGDQPAGGGPVSPGSRMSTRARPPLTVTSGAPSALPANGDQRLVARRGRWIGGLRRDGAGVFDETNTDGAARDLDAAGRAEAGQRDHRRLAFLCKTVRNGERGIAPGVCVLTLGQGLDECLTGLVDGLPVGIVAGLLDGLFQRLVEGIGFDRYSVVVVGCVAATDGIVSHWPPPHYRHRLRLPCIRVRYRR